MRSLLARRSSSEDNFTFERLLSLRGFSRIAGTDEAGRGPLAGPVVAASVILPPNCNPAIFCDSKTTTARQRSEIKQYLEQIEADIGVGIISPRAIDRTNILQASLLAMKESLADLSKSGSEPDFVLIDGNQKLLITIPQETLVKGDARSASIGAASIIAKITRDAIMAEYDKCYPGYNFTANKGYPTKEHRQAIRTHGPCPVHRYTFKGVKEFVPKTDKPR